MESPCHGEAVVRGLGCPLKNNLNACLLSERAAGGEFFLGGDTPSPEADPLWTTQQGLCQSSATSAVSRGLLLMRLLSGGLVSFKEKVGVLSWS